MNKLEQALLELHEMDVFAAKASWIHRLNPLSKLLSTFCYIIAVASFGKYSLGSLFAMILWPIILYQIAGIPVSKCFIKLKMVLPLVLFVGIFNPILDRRTAIVINGIAISAGFISFLVMALKGVFCLLASFLLIATTPIDSICLALRQLHLPSILVSALLLTYRYAQIMMEELSNMSIAYHLRAPGQKGIHIKAWGSFLGQALLRSTDRASELYQSMCLRGYRDDFHYAKQASMSFRDLLFFIISCLYFIVIRLYYD